MNHVERFKAVMAFEPVDRLPRWEWASWWDKTVARWHTEGLSPELTDIFEISRHFGLDPYKQFWFGAVQAIPEALRRHIDGGLGCMEDYLAIRPYLYPDCSATVEAMIPWAGRQQDGEVVVWITLEGCFWFPRTLMGFEKLFYAYGDQPDLIHRMNSDLLEFNLGLLDRVSKACVPTFMTIAEDMSYNHGPMISRAICEEFMEPYYRPLVTRAKEMGMKVIVDTDGDVTLMVPWLTDVGVDGVLPLERQAGVDGGKLREQFPSLCMIGHYDKMVMKKGEAAMRQEFDRLVPVMKTGGYIPSVDHQTPPDVSIENYAIYLKLLEEYTSL